jgi:hypothetical protein
MTQGQDHVALNEVLSLSEVAKASSRVEIDGWVGRPDIQVGIGYWASRAPSQCSRDLQTGGLPASARGLDGTAGDGNQVVVTTTEDSDLSSLA